MAIAITEQTAVFFHSLLLGAVLGCFYDLFRITRIAFLMPALLVLIEDLLFFLFSSIALFGFLLENNDGQIRWFILLGVVLGWTVYYFTAGSLVMKCSARIIAGVRAVLAFLWRPFAWAGDRSARVARRLEKRGRNTIFRVKTGLKSHMVMMYNMKNKEESRKNLSIGGQNGGSPGGAGNRRGFLRFSSYRKGR